MVLFLLVLAYTRITPDNHSKENIMSDFEVLPKENFIAATFLGPDQLFEDVRPRWQGYEAELTERGLTALYPLREDNCGGILPHIYAEKMRRQDGRNKKGALSMVHLHVNMIYAHNGSVDNDYPTENFMSLLTHLSQDPYSERPELAAQVGETFELFKDVREAQRTKIAAALSKTIGRNELYVVSADTTEWRTPDEERNLYVARLTGIVNIRRNPRMYYKIVVRGTDGREGFLPSTFYVPGGVSAPAA
jgi:hypothetical protein